MAYAEDAIVPELAAELRDVYAPHQQVLQIASGAKSEKRFVDAHHCRLMVPLIT